MKKIFLLSCLAFAVSIKAQDEKCFKKGTSVISVGAGIGNDINGYGIKPVYAANFEYGIAKVGPGVIGAGVSGNCLVNYYNYGTDRFGYRYKNVYTTTVVGLRGTYHPDFCNGKKYDVYGAVLLNVYIDASSLTSNAPESPNGHTSSIKQISPGLVVGVRYFFTPNLGVFSEFGYDFAVLKAGLSVKFGGK